MQNEEDVTKVVILKLCLTIAIPVVLFLIVGLTAICFLKKKSEITVAGSLTAVSAPEISDQNATLKPGQSVSVASASLNTGNLTEYGNGYEGIPGTGDYNYGEALQKSILFYELQRSGNLPETTRCNWRGDSGLTDGSDVGLDLTGGWYDAGDHVKFNLPMAYSSTMLGWSVYEDRAAYEESGQLEYILADIRWVNDYLIKCHPEDEVFYYQVGNGSTDHSWWGPAEAMQMERPAYCVTADAPGSAVTGEAAASLAVCSIVFKDSDPEYSALCLEHAKSLYAFAESTCSDAGYTQAAGFYDSWSGYYDELSWAAAWLYLATEETEYLEKSKEYYPLAGQDYDWALCWDDVHIGAAVLLARITDDSYYSDIVEQHLDYWTVGTSDGSRITYTPEGLAWLDSWGALRYATTTAYVASVYSEWDGCPDDKRTTYWDFAVAQAGYVLGDTGFSYQIGFGENYPQHPHHRTSQGSYCNNMNEPQEARHTLYGALVGGPDATDNYTDEVSNYTTNEVACDYNAGFTGLLANLYSQYHGETLIDFGAVEVVDTPEFYVDGQINVDGSDFIEIKAVVYNVSAWPARVPNHLELRYFVDLSEVYEAGGSVDNIEVTCNYMQAGTANGLVAWDEDNHIYYLSVDFSDAAIYPGGQENYKKEIQVRLRNSMGVWDNSNDPSFEGMSSTLATCPHIALYEDGVLLSGVEPTEGNHTSNSTGTSGNSASAPPSSAPTSPATASTNPSTSTASSSSSSDQLSVAVTYDGMNGNSGSITGTMKITNIGDQSIALNKLEIDYYITEDNPSAMVYSCYHAAINSSGGNYQAVNGVNATFSALSNKQSNCMVAMSMTDTVNLEAGDELTINFCINRSDWSQMNTGDDYSVKMPDHIVIKNNGTIIFGTQP